MAVSLNDYIEIWLLSTDLDVSFKKIKYLINKALESSLRIAVSDKLSDFETLL